MRYFHGLLQQNSIPPSSIGVQANIHLGGSNPVLPEWSQTNVLSFARINVISARIEGVNCPSPDPPSRMPMPSSHVIFMKYQIGEVFTVFILRCCFVMKIVDLLQSWAYFFHVFQNWIQEIVHCNCAVSQAIADDAHTGVLCVQLRLQRDAA